MKWLERCWKQTVVIFLLVCSIVIWVHVLQSKPNKNAIISFLDVGEGDATLIVSRNKTKVLIDAGPSRAVLGPLAKALPLFDRELDLLIEMYPDQDNSGGIPFVLSQYHVPLVLIARDTKESLIHDEVKRMQNEQGFQIQEAYEGMNIDLRDGSELIVLSAKENESLVLKYIDQNNCILFMGSIQGKEESRFIATHQNISCQIVKIGHHGSKQGTSEELLSAVRPEFAILSNGKDNRYGYPATEVLQRLSDKEITILNTMERGTITFFSDGEIWTQK